MKMDLGISGKTAVVTGGAMGIGRAIAEEFAQNGMRVVIADRSAEQPDSCEGQRRWAALSFLRAAPELDLRLRSPDLGNWA